MHVSACIGMCFWGGGGSLTGLPYESDPRQSSCCSSTPSPCGKHESLRDPDTRQTPRHNLPTLSQYSPKLSHWDHFQKQQMKSRLKGTFLHELQAILEMNVSDNILYFSLYIALLAQRHTFHGCRAFQVCVSLFSSACWDTQLNPNG